MKLRAVVPLLASLLVAITAVLPWQAGYALPFPDPALGKIWERNDWPVANGTVERAWTLGPVAFLSTDEIYGGDPSQTRQVQYYDKSRLELNDPWGDRTSPWFVTSGLLVKEMISGQIQIGDHRFQPYVPAEIPIAGDPGPGNQNAPTYASLRNVASLDGENRAESEVGQVVTQAVGSDGVVRESTAISVPTKIGVYEKESGHNIPEVFWEFLNAKGLIYQQGKYAEGLLMDWPSVTGYPITEPYWTRVAVGGVEKDVMIQAFERRVLTFTPTNPPGWQVEMGNVGRHYYWWRYQSTLSMLQTVQAGNWEVKVNSAEKNKMLIGGRYLGSTTASGVFVTVFLTITNDGPEPATLPDPTLVDAQGRSFRVDGMASLHASYYFSSKSGYIETIQPGATEDVVVSFDVDPSSTGLRIRLTPIEQPSIAVGVS